MASIALSVLDTAPVWQGSTPAQSLRDMVDLAKRVERLGYTRYWVAEHHNTLSIASSSPPVLVAQLANHTSTLRVGSGGVMLPNHSPLVVAEQFGTLEALHPGRIDLGIGRAPGTDPNTARALRNSGEDFPGQLTELMGYFDEPKSDALHAIPAPGNRPSVWLLGSSSASAVLAGRLGLPYAFAHHINPDAAVPALAAYRAEFVPSAIAARPRVIIATLVIAADTQEKAEWLASSLGMMILRMRDGLSQGQHVPPDQAARYPYAAAERELIGQQLGKRIIGDPEAVRRGVSALLDSTDADELMAITLIHNQADRIRCYELLAQAAR